MFFVILYITLNIYKFKNNIGSKWSEFKNDFEIKHYITAELYNVMNLSD